MNYLFALFGYSEIIRVFLLVVLLLLAYSLRNKVVDKLVDLAKKFIQFPFLEANEHLYKDCRPLKFLFVVAAFDILFNVLIVSGLAGFRFDFLINVVSVISLIPFEAIYIILVGLFINNILEFLAIYYKDQNGELAVNLSNTLLYMTCKVARVLVLIFLLGMVLSELGYDVSGIFAGLGLGGVAVALAAQDTISNLFGCVVILFDKPFEINDWIQTSDVEGIVEEISFRSTRIRTFQNAVVAVPNSSLANSLITNWSKMEERKLRFYINLTYSTKPEQIKAIKENVLAYLNSCSFVAEGSARVTFEELSASSLDLRVDAVITEKDIGPFLACREEINFKVIDIVNEHQGSFAFPSQSIYIEQMPE